MCEQFYLNVSTQIEQLNDVLQWFEDNIKSRLPEKAAWESQLALAEGFTNTVLYAHQNLPETTPIELSITLSAKLLEIQIWDRGQPFNLAEKLATILASNHNPLDKDHERGLFLMEALTDELQYIRREMKNCLIMRKNLHT